MGDVTRVFVPDGGNFGGNGMEGMLLGSMMNGGGGFGGGMWNNPIWAIVFLAALRNGGIFGNNGYENNSQLSAIQEQLNTNHGQTLLMDAIKGNGSAVHELATTIGCNHNVVQTAINGIQATLASVGNQSNMNAMQVVNAIQSGNTALSNQLSQCCCDNKLMTTQQGYENRIANAEQTAILGGKIDAQTTLINDKFCQLEMREMQNKLDSERAKTLALTNQISQEHQNADIARMVLPLQADINDIKCKLPQTVTVPYSPVTPVPSCVAWNAALYGGYPYGGGRGQIWS